MGTKNCSFESGRTLSSRTVAREAVTPDACQGIGTSGEGSQDSRASMWNRPGKGGVEGTSTKNSSGPGGKKKGSYASAVDSSGKMAYQGALELNLTESQLEQLKKHHGVEVVTEMSKNALVKLLVSHLQFTPVSVSKLGKGILLALFQSKEQMERVLGTKITTKDGKEVLITRVGTPTYKFIMRDVPGIFSKSRILFELSKLGKVVLLRENLISIKIPRGDGMDDKDSLETKTIRTGDWMVSIQLASIKNGLGPRSLSFDGWTFALSSVDRCFFCGAKGHMKVDCPLGNQKAGLGSLKGPSSVKPSKSVENSSGVIEMEIEGGTDGEMAGKKRKKKVANSTLTAELVGTSTTPLAPRLANKPDTGTTLQKGGTGEVSESEEAVKAALLKEKNKAKRKAYKARRKARGKVDGNMSSSDYVDCETEMDHSSALEPITAPFGPVKVNGEFFQNVSSVKTNLTFDWEALSQKLNLPPCVDFIKSLSKLPQYEPSFADTHVIDKDVSTLRSFKVKVSKNLFGRHLPYSILRGSSNSKKFTNLLIASMSKSGKFLTINRSQVAVPGNQVKLAGTGPDVRIRVHRTGIAYANIVGKVSSRDKVFAEPVIGNRKGRKSRNTNANRTKTMKKPRKNTLRGNVPVNQVEDVEPTIPDKSPVMREESITKVSPLGETKVVNEGGEELQKISLEPASVTKGFSLRDLFRIGEKLGEGNSSVNSVD